MAPSDDNTCRAIAKDIERQRPGWMIIWGCYSHRYTAYPLFPVRRRVIVIAYYPGALITRMDDAERILRIPPRSKGDTPPMTAIPEYADGSMHDYEKLRAVTGKLTGKENEATDTQTVDDRMRLVPESEATHDRAQDRSRSADSLA